MLEPLTRTAASLIGTPVRTPDGKATPMRTMPAVAEAVPPCRANERQHHRFAFIILLYRCAEFFTGTILIGQKTFERDEGRKLVLATPADGEIRSFRVECRKHAHVQVAERNVAVEQIRQRRDYTVTKGV